MARRASGSAIGFRISMIDQAMNRSDRIGSIEERIDRIGSIEERMD